MIKVMIVIALFSQLMIDGKVPGKLWRTDKASGIVEVMHVWGRSAVVPATGAWVNIDGKKIRIGVHFNPPVLDGAIRKNYNGPTIAWEMGEEWSDGSQVLTTTQVQGYGDDYDVIVLATAMVTFENDKPTSLVYTVVEHAEFDVAEFRVKLKAGGVLSNRVADSLEGFNEQGYRQRTVTAKF